MIKSNICNREIEVEMADGSQSLEPLTQIDVKTYRKCKNLRTGIKDKK